MIDVQINPFGRTLMTLALGALKYQAVQQQNNINAIKKQSENIKSLQVEQERWNDISFQLTTNMLDKRFSDSKQFIQSGGSKNVPLRLKKSSTANDKQVLYIAQQNMLKSRVKYNNNASSYNQRIIDKKLQSSFKLIDIR